MQCRDFPNETPCNPCKAFGKPKHKPYWDHTPEVIPRCLILQCSAAMNVALYVADKKSKEIPEPGSAEAKRPRLDAQERIRKFFISAMTRKDDMYRRCLLHALQADYPKLVPLYEKLMMLR